MKIKTIIKRLIYSVLLLVITSILSGIILETVGHGFLRGILMFGAAMLFFKIWNGFEWFGKHNLINYLSDNSNNSNSSQQA